MYLTPKELDRLLVFLAAELGRRRKEKGLKLNLPEARAIIADEICEGAREGKSVAELMSLGRSILTTDEVLPGVADLMDTLMVEPMFPDGQKLVCVHDPIAPGVMPVETQPPGRYQLAPDDVVINQGSEVTSVRVRNLGDRPIQVGSHFHFFEVNPDLEFDRPKTFGFRLDIPAGTTVRFEPGDEKDVDLVAFGGERRIEGLNRLTDGLLDDPQVRATAIRRAAAQGFRGV
ncbi:urease subunit beta [Microvirga massiliensis]|uniref:urease subunit beta n=1 Tax=Microvirga massiliensis TaxID=1033741 RepID=UPI00062BB717|nr:urease subunit beta [Microvirga massiliensis]